MTAAMMLPLLADQVRIVAMRSLWSRRQRAMILFAVGYLAAWMIAGLLLIPILALVAASSWIHASAMASALVWHRTGVRRRALRACHRAPHLAPHGRRADADCIVHGVRVGAPCVMACGPWMLAAGHSWWGMGAVTAILLVERYRPRHPQGLPTPLRLPQLA